MTRRTSDHSKPRPPPPTLREPTVKSALPARIGAAIAGTASGSCSRPRSVPAGSREGRRSRGHGPLIADARGDVRCSPPLRVPLPPLAWPLNRSTRRPPRSAQSRASQRGSRQIGAR
eukprot:scaffold59538_cov61-Phaeocystis_antarctica.AAC.7